MRQTTEERVKLLEGPHNWHLDRISTEKELDGELLL